MDNGMPQIGQISMQQAVEAKAGIQLPKLSVEMMKLVQIGELININIEQNVQGNIQSSVIINGRTYSLPLDEKTAQFLSKGETVEVPVRVNVGGKLTLIKHAVEENVVKSTLPLEKNSALASVEVEPLKLEHFIDTVLQEKKIPQKLRQEITKNISSLKVSMQSIGLTDTDEQALLRPLYQLLEKVATHPEEITNIKSQLITELNRLVGSEINGSVSEQINDMTRIKTIFGETFFDSKIKLPLNENLTLNIDGLTPIYQKELKFLDTLVKVISPHRTMDLKPETIAVTPQLRHLATTLSSLPETISEMILNKLPVTENNLFQNIYNLYQGVESKDVARWIGPQIVKKITQEVSESPKVLQELQTFVSSAFKETPIWRIIEMPLFDGNQFFPLKIAVKRETEQEDKQTTSKDNGTRFVVETTFSNLGSFQFDGLSHTQQKRLDLIIRTSAQQSDDFCSNIINLFKKSLYDVGYTGTIKINRQESFINLLEQSGSGEGIYI